MESVDVEKDLLKYANKDKAKVLQGYFKTGKGEYGEGDIFIGVTVPIIRTIAKKHTYIDLEEISKLFKSKIHEHRLVALKILIFKYEELDKDRVEKISGEKIQKELVDFYLNNLNYINNWDLVDASAPHILGNHILKYKKSGRKFLYKLVQSKNIWERRIAIISTLTLIRNNDFDDTLKLSEILLKDKHDLIHKAVGWMLRELGKRNENRLIIFLDKYADKMPRTMLRYSIEKFSDIKRKEYLNR